MIEKVKPYLEKAKAFLKKIPKKIMIAVAVLLLAALAVVIWMNNRPYAVLFTDLTSGEMSSILTYLEGAGVTDIKVENNDTILVPDNQEADLKARLLMEGYPQSGFAYRYPESTGLLSTESERSKAALRDLEGKLSAVVSCFDGVNEASVNISPGDDNRYVLDSNRSIKATAGVFLRMKDGYTLTQQQADGIRNLIAHSVKGLEIGAVSITDNLGNNYNKPLDADAADADASALKLQLEQEWENKIRTNVLAALIPWFGEENVKVSVNCTVDVSRTVENSTDVILPEWADDGSTNGRGIVGSRIFNYVVVRGDEETPGGVPGTSTNSDLNNFPEYVEDLPNTDGATHVEVSGQTDYDNSRNEKHIIRTAGYLTDCMISVTINETTAGTINRQEIMRHVARASGITGSRDEDTGEEHLEDKISVLAKPFYVEPSVLPVPGSPVEMWMIYAGIAGLVLFLIILTIILLVLRRRKKRKMAMAGENYDVDAILAAAAAHAAEAENSGADVMSMQSERSIELRQAIRKFTEDNPEIAAQMIRAWLRGDDDNG